MVNSIRRGYRIQFASNPPLASKPVVFSSYTKNSQKWEALDAEVSSMLLKGAIEEVQFQRGFYSRMFVVPKPNGKFRPIIDLSTLNNYIVKRKFSMQTVASVLQSVRTGDWMISVDLKDAYFQIPVHPVSRKFLMFRWEGKTYQFRVLCFGLTTAPQVFTKVFAPVAAFLHNQGIRLLRYLDDWLVLAESEQELLQAKDRLLELCRRLNIEINLSKSSLTPSQVSTYLGMTIDSIQGKAFPSEERIGNLLSLVGKFLAIRAPPAEMWQQLLGHLASLTQVVPGGRIRMRRLQRQLRLCWSQASQEPSFPVPWNSLIQEDLRWWSDMGNLLQGQSFGSPIPDIHATSDASTKGWGMTLATHSVQGSWTPEEQRLHINLLELRAIRLGLAHFQALVKDKVVSVVADNTTALAYIKKGGGTVSLSLSKEAVRLLKWAEGNNTSLVTGFIRGKNNVTADALSRKHQVLPTEWTLHQEVCNDLWRTWGQPVLDLFATRDNYRIQAFVSPHPDQMAVATDAFSVRWDGLHLYAFPPYGLIQRVLNKLLTARDTSLVLITPFAPRKPWWPDLLSLAAEPPRRLPLRPDLLRQPHFHRFHRNLQGLNLIGWRLSSTCSRRMGWQQEKLNKWPTLGEILPL